MQVLTPKHSTYQYLQPKSFQNHHTLSKNINIASDHVPRGAAISWKSQTLQCHLPKYSTQQEYRQQPTSTN
jgi:hypothetical protein